MKNKKTANAELGRLSVEEFKKKEKIPISVVLDDIRSLNNIGSVFRTADAFALEQIILCGITAKPPHREIQKTALGATESVDWLYESSVVEAIEKLKNEGYKVAAIEQAEKKVWLQDVSYSGEKMAVVFGNEVKGVSQQAVDVCDFVIEIPQFGTKHSLNISVSAGVVLWHLVHQVIDK
ncbi:MAG TPA: RNA methyltransferase [Flavobacteriales bacterium]|nr:RNA methyltransferase [Flavobacteriales bacterium]|tara:strand:- start:37865 stop:38401 length:537 start_codon:yes stop_codon:yes gene_type:complete